MARSDDPLANEQASRERAVEQQAVDERAFDERGGELTPGTRRLLIGWTALLGPVLGWAALRLPWRPDAPLALLLWALAAANACTLVALLGSGRRVRLALGVLVASSLVAVPWLAGAIISSSVVLVRMYGALGWGLTVALAAIGWLLLLATLPIGLFGLHCLRRRGHGHTA